jgi:hypothetical protein
MRRRKTILDDLLENEGYNNQDYEIMNEINK